LVIVASPLAAQRKTEKFDSSWRFHLGDAPGAQDVAFDDAAWRSLDVPHDWSIEGEFSEQNPAGVGGGALPGGVGWYRKTFAVPAADSASRNGSRLLRSARAAWNEARSPAIAFCKLPPNCGRVGSSGRSTETAPMGGS